MGIAFASGLCSWKLGRRCQHDATGSVIGAWKQLHGRGKRNKKETPSEYTLKTLLSSSAVRFVSVFLSVWGLVEEGRESGGIEKTDLEVYVWERKEEVEIDREDIKGRVTERMQQHLMQMQPMMAAYASPNQVTTDIIQQVFFSFFSSPKSVLLRQSLFYFHCFAYYVLLWLWFSSFSSSFSPPSLWNVWKWERMDFVNAWGLSLAKFFLA